MQDSLHDILRQTRVVPVAVFSSVKSALDIAAILSENSIPVIEITLRTPEALKCIEAVAGTFKDMMVGAGSVLSSEALKKAADSGARFGVAPCLDTDVTAAAASLGIPFIPGVSTPSELNAALKLKFGLIKLFPAANLGGAAYISAMTAPFRMYSYHLIPTGGINQNNLPEYLKNPRVIACGASYFIDGALIEAGDYNGIRERVANVKKLIAAL